MSDKKQYVLGFCFLPDNRCILIKKTKPTWIVGYFNGIGGHIEPGETPIEAMCREFFEEAGILTNKEDWKFSIKLISLEWEMTIFYCKLIYYPLLRTICDEGTIGAYETLPENTEPTARWAYNNIRGL